MAYRYDEDLEFLKNINSLDLYDLERILKYDENYNRRLTERLTYNEWNDFEHAEWELVAEELQKFGGNTIANIVRRKGVPYREILCDVCDKLKVNYNKKSDTTRIEQELLSKILTDALDKMSEYELKELAEELKADNIHIPKGQICTATFIRIFQAGGFQSYIWTLKIANIIVKALIGRGLSLGGNVLLAQTMKVLTGPIGWVLTGLWTVYDIAGPAYRVTIPAVITVIALRQKHRLETDKTVSGYLEYQHKLGVMQENNASVNPNDLNTSPASAVSLVSVSKM